METNDVCEFISKSPLHKDPRDSKLPLLRLGTEPEKRLLLPFGTFLIRDDNRLTQAKLSIKNN
ncbi:hypothetical protein YQE_05935, partial [Dendroctonus ponderosae]